MQKKFFTDNEPIYNLKSDMVKPGLFFQKKKCIIIIIIIWYCHLGHTLKKKSLPCALKATSSEIVCPQDTPTARPHK